MSLSWQRLVLALIFWTFIAVSFASQFYMASSQAGLPVSWYQALVSSLFDWYVFAGLSWPTIWLSRNFRLEGTNGFRHAAFHLAASMTFSVLYVILRCLVGKLQIQVGASAQSFTSLCQALFLKTWHYNALVYWVIVSVTHALDYYRKYQERALRAAELEKRLAQAKLQALQMQLNPHFLFNTLNAISVLMRRDVDAADTMITRLGQLLRYGLESTDTQEVPLRQEILFLKRYLEIEQMRFGDRLQLEFSIAEDTWELLVPNLILQPLVENAIKHGIEPKSQQGTIWMSTSLENNQLKITVQDNGKGFRPSENRREGVGLKNTRSRLSHLYGREQVMEINNRESGGTSVCIRIPVRIAGSETTQKDPSQLNSSMR